jgi:hypothetical protein
MRSIENALDFLASSFSTALEGLLVGLISMKSYILVGIIGVKCAVIGLCLVGAATHFT